MLLISTHPSYLLQAFVFVEIFRIDYRCRIILQFHELMIFWQLHFTQSKQVIGGAVECSAKCGKLTEVDLYRLSAEHFICRKRIDAYLQQVGSGMQDVSCCQDGFQIQYDTAIVGRKCAAFFSYHIMCITIFEYNQNYLLN